MRIETTPEYIERDVVLKELNRNSLTKTITFSDGVSIYDTIKELPTADVVEVVRCKECAYHNTSPCPMRLSLGFTNNNNFCSYGERRE